MLNAHSKNIICSVVSALILAGCATNNGIPKDFKYDCSFNYFDYDPDAPHIKADRLGDVFAWISNRVKGELSYSPGLGLKNQIERYHFLDQKRAREGFAARKIWTIGAKSTKNNNPMNVIIDKRDKTYYITRVRDEHVSALGLNKDVILVLARPCPLASNPWLESGSDSDVTAEPAS